jgi:hypothetical protein
MLGSTWSLLITVLSSCMAEIKACVRQMISNHNFLICMLPMRLNIDRRRQQTTMNRLQVLVGDKLHLCPHWVGFSPSWRRQTQNHVSPNWWASVSSESTFSTGGRVLDDYRSSLRPKMVEALVCGASFIKGSKNNRVKPTIPVVSLLVTIFLLDFIHSS